MKTKQTDEMTVAEAFSRINQTKLSILIAPLGAIGVGIGLVLGIETYELITDFFPVSHTAICR